MPILPGLAKMPLHELRGLTRITQALLAAQTVLAVAAVFIAYLSKVGANSPASGLIVPCQLAIFVAAGIAFLMWTYRAKSNAGATGARGLSYSPAMAVGSYFIPILNLGMPAQAMQELYKSSADPRDWEAVDSLRLIHVWWFFWISGNIAGVVAWRLQTGEAYQASASVIGMLSSGSDIGTMAASLCLIPIIGKIAGLQHDSMAMAAEFE